MFLSLLLLFFSTYYRYLELFAVTVHLKSLHSFKYSVEKVEFTQFITNFILISGQLVTFYVTFIWAAKSVVSSSKSVHIKNKTAKINTIKTFTRYN